MRVYGIKNRSKSEGKIYTILEDDHGEEDLYSKENPVPLDGSSKGGRWEIISKY